MHLATHRAPAHRACPSKGLKAALAAALLLLTAPPALAGDEPSPAKAQTPAEKGLAIAKEADHRDSGFGDSVVRVRMTLKNRQGDESTREMRFFTLESKDPKKGDKTLVVVDSPADVKGTALLTHDNILQPDDQWIYLPALKRVKRISSVNKSGPFMGSEFAFEDMGSQDVAKYSYLWLRDEACPGLPKLKCAVIQRTPLYEYSAYTKEIAWIDLAGYRVHKVDYYDRKNSLLKTLKLTRYGLYLKRYWRPHEMDMVNHQTGKETTILTSEYQFQTGIDEGLFDKNNLDRVK